MSASGNDPPAAPSTVDHTPAEGPGARLGPYKLLQQIGEGGMGTVFMAEQEQPVRRRVALKVIKPGMDSAHVLARFRAEQQALALMDHPHIARVFDAGVTASGRPYFVMELVHGVPITKYCDDNKLTPRERLELFVPVCRAVQHAHQKGIIHRDLKPSNVLVCLYDGKPVAKVIDFGVAKAMEQPLTEQTLFTQFGQVVGTLEYMSPEQAEMSQLGIDTRSDIYSLGVMLYELLTGTTPLQRQRLKQAALDEVLRLIREEEPQAPSARLSSSTETLPTISQQRRTEPAQLRKLVRGELDWIALKALEKDRTRRYSTADGLAQDIEHYLMDEPVEACPPSLTYRLRKYARKHRVLLTTSALFVLLLLAGSGISVWQAMRATLAEGDALDARAEAVEDRDKAVKARDDERAARAGERQAQQALNDAHEKVRRALYVADLNLVRVAWDTDQVQRAFDLLERHRPRAGETDLRGFEWFYWKRKLRSETRHVQLEDFAAEENLDSSRAFQTPSFSDSGKLCASLRRAPQGGNDVDVKVWSTQTGKVMAWITYHPASASFVPQGSPLKVPLAFSPDETHLIVMSTWQPGKSMQSHDVLALAERKRLFTIQAIALRFLPDGKRLLALAGSEDGQREFVWHDAQTGAPLKRLAAPGRSFTISHDGALLAALHVPDAATGLCEEIHVIDTATGRLRHKIALPGPLQAQDPVAMRCSANGKRLLIGPWWKTPRGSLVSGSKLVESHRLLFVDLETGAILWTRALRPMSALATATVSPDGSQILLAGAGTTEADGAPVLLDGLSGQGDRPLSGGFRRHDTMARPGNLLSYSPDGELIVAECPGVGFTVFAARTGKLVFQTKYLGVGQLLQLGGKLFDERPHVARDGTQHLTANHRGEVRSWDTTAWHLAAHAPKLPDSDNRDVRVYLHQDGRRIVALQGRAAFPKDPEPRTLKIFDLAVGRLLRAVRALPASTFHVVDPAGDGILVSAPFQDGMLKRIDPEQERDRVFFPRADAEELRTVPWPLFLPERRLLVLDPVPSQPRPPLLRLYKPVLVHGDTGERLASWWDKLTKVEYCAISGDGRTAAIVLYERRKPLTQPLRHLLLAETATGRQHAEVRNLELGITGCVLSPDGRLVAVHGRTPTGGLLQVRDARSGALRFVVQIPSPMPFTSICTFSADSRRLCIFDGPSSSFRIWDDAGNELAVIPSSDAIQETALFTKDGARLLTVRRGWERLPPAQMLEVIDATPLPGDEPGAPRP